jgi:tetratricopeptide (TPR) repeat protein
MANAPGDEAARLMEHVVTCDRCGERLRVLVELDQQELTAEEKSLIERIRPKAGDPIATPRLQPRPRRKLSWRTLAVTAAALLVVVGLPAWLYFNQPERRAERMLAEAYTEQRMFDWRLPDRGWSARNLQLAANNQRPLPLLDAQALLARTSGDTNPVLLDLKGRAELLEFRIDSAIKVLEPACVQDSKSPDYWTNLAIAYGLRAERDNRPMDYGVVVEYTTSALQLDPKNARALFNRALAFERLSMVPQAIADWQAFLQVEKDPGWRREASMRLESLQQIQNQRGALLRSEEINDSVLERIAFEWLTTDRERARTADTFLEIRYGDTWLREAAGERTDSAPLNRAVEAAATGEYDQALGEPGCDLWLTQLPANAACSIFTSCVR